MIKTIEDFRTTKLAMMRAGKSAEEIRDYTFNRFESVVSSNVGNNILIDINRCLNFSCLYKNYKFSVYKDKYIIYCNDKSVECFVIEKWKIADILDLEGLMQEIIILLFNGCEVVINIEN